MPNLRSDHAAAGALAPDRAWARRALAAGAHPVLEVRLHLPLTRQSKVYAREGIELDVSTLADWVGASAATLMPFVDAMRDHVFAAERIHADDTTVPVLAKGKTRTGRLWTYVRDDRPFGGRDPPAASSSTRLIAARSIRNSIWPVMPGSCRRTPMPGSTGSTTPVANPVRSSRRRAGRMRGASSSTWRGSTRRRLPLKPLSAPTPCSPSSARSTAPPRKNVCASATNAAGRSLSPWRVLREQRAKLSGQSKVAKAIAYSLTRWVALTRFLDDGRLCMSNNAAEREIRPLVMGRHNWTFAGSDRGGQRAAAIYTLIQTPTSTRRRGSPTSSRVCRIIRPSGSTSSCPGAGSPNASKKPLRSDAKQNQSRLSTIKSVVFTGCVPFTDRDVFEGHASDRPDEVLARFLGRVVFIGGGPPVLAAYAPFVRHWDINRLP